MDDHKLNQFVITALFGAVTFFLGESLKNKRIDTKDQAYRDSLDNLEGMIQGLNLTLSTLTVQVQSFTKEVEKLREMHDRVIRAEERILALERAKSDGST